MLEQETKRYFGFRLGKESLHTIENASATLAHWGNDGFFSRCMFKEKTEHIAYATWNRAHRGENGRRPRKHTAHRETHPQGHRTFVLVSTVKAYERMTVVPWKAPASTRTLYALSAKCAPFFGEDGGEHARHYTALHCTALHDTTRHDTILRYATLRYTTKSSDRARNRDVGREQENRA